MSKRILLLILVNFAITLILGITLNIIYMVLGIDTNGLSGILIFSTVFGFGGALVSLFLSKNMALHAVGGQIITNPKNEVEQWLLNTVKNQAMKAKIPMPDVAIYHSHDVNAFATGASKNNSLVAVSSALLKEMTKDEAEAVLAHEIAHINNGDMITMTLLQGVLNTFVIFLSRVLASMASGRGDNRNYLAFFLINMFLQIVLGFLASLIAMWFSRQREFRADAGSAQLVGKEKMIMALERLKNLHEPQELDSTLAAFMINGTRTAELLMSHPPLEKRIQALRKL